MNVADSISIFAEGTFEEQVQELVTYLARTHPETERQAFIQPFQEAVKTEQGQKPFAEDIQRRRTVVKGIVKAINGLGVGSDREQEGFFNLVFSQMFSDFELGSSDLQEITTHIIKSVVDGSSDGVQVKLRILANLYNCIPRKSGLRLAVCNALVDLAVKEDDMDVLHFSFLDVERWLAEWDVSSEEKSSFLRYVADAYTTVGRTESAYTYTVAYVRSLPPSSPQSTTAALDLLASALRSPTIFDFDGLLKLENIKLLNSHDLFALLQIFVKGGLSEYNEWEARHESLLDGHHLEKSNLLRKMRLLIFVSLGFNKIGQNLSYAEIAEALKVDTCEVEKWTIDVIRTGLLSGKLSQATQTLHVTRASPRGFGAEQWNALEQRLLLWKTGLSGIHAILSSALRGSASVALNGVDRTQSQPA